MILSKIILQLNNFLYSILRLVTMELENTFKCKLCDKSYNSKDVLLIHEKNIHVKEGITFPCDKCTKIFANKNSLSKHTKTKHMGRRFQCNDCDKSFSENSTLAKHFRD